MSIKLSDTQLVMLSAAAQRDDRCLTLPEKLKGAAAHKVATKLIAAGLVEEVKAKTGMPVWRRDEQDGQSYALTLTAAGAKAIAVNPDDDASPAGDEERSPPEVDQSPTSAESDRTAAGASAAESAQAFATPRAPRVGYEVGEGDRDASSNRRSDDRRIGASDGLAAAYHPRCPDGPAQARLRSDARSIRCGTRLSLSHRPRRERRAAGPAPTAIEPPIGEPIDGASDPAASRAPATATRRSRATRAPRAA